MKSLRPLAGALLATLILLTSVNAAEVGIINPPGGSGSTELAPPRDEPAPPRDEPDRNLPVDPAPPHYEPRPSRDKDSDSSMPASEPPLQTRHFGSMVELTCAIADRPDAIVVVNHSSEPLPPGTRIKWQLKAEGVQGFFRLLGTLEGGATLVADNVLRKQVNNGANCIARVI